jgi:hypothetical protein
MPGVCDLEDRCMDVAKGDWEDVGHRRRDEEIE